MLPDTEKMYSYLFSQIKSIQPPTPPSKKKKLFQAPGYFSGDNFYSPLIPLDLTKEVKNKVPRVQFTPDDGPGRKVVLLISPQTFNVFFFVRFVVNVLSSLYWLTFPNIFFILAYSKKKRKPHIHLKMLYQVVPHNCFK